jgi:Raf kinase inhibitor-like YbhB/YbcL family protein
MRLISFACVIALALLAAGCVEEQEPAATSEAVSDVAAEVTSEEPTDSLILASPAFERGGMIPAKYTCDGDDVSPPLTWSDPPEGTESFALIMDDPDAVEVAGKVWVHWLLYNLPGDARSLPEGIKRDVALYPDARAGKGHSGDGYGGPCPPPGRLHNYHFKLYALDADLDLRGGLMKAGLLKAIEGHVLAKAEVAGRYSRQE